MDNEIKTLRYMRARLLALLYINLFLLFLLMVMFQLFRGV